MTYIENINFALLVADAIYIESPLFPLEYAPMPSLSVKQISQKTVQ